MSIRAVVWDVDDTLFDYTTADREGMRAHLVAEGLLAGYGTAEEALVRWREITDQQWARFSAGEVDFVTQRRDRTRVFLGRPELTDAEADDWFQRYVTHYEAAWSSSPTSCRSWTPSPAPTGTPCSPIPASPSRTASCASSACTTVSRPSCAPPSWGSPSRSPAPSSPPATPWASPRGETAYVGDHPEIDGRGAADAGLLSVWIDRGGAYATLDPPAGPRRIASLSELPAILGADTRFGAPSTFR